MKIIIGALLAALSITSALAETVLITGTNRGIGLEFVKQYAERGATVIATARRPFEARELTALASRYPNVAIEALDVTDVAAIEALAKKYQGKPVDIGGYYKADSEKCKAVMRPSATLNAALKAARV